MVNITFFRPAGYWRTWSFSSFYAKKSTPHDDNCDSSRRSRGDNDNNISDCLDW